MLRSLLGEFILGARKAVDILSPDSPETTERLIAEFEAARAKHEPKLQAIVDHLEEHERRALRDAGCIDTDGRVVE